MLDEALLLEILPRHRRAAPPAGVDATEFVSFQGDAVAEEYAQATSAEVAAILADLDVWARQQGGELDYLEIESEALRKGRLVREGGHVTRPLILPRDGFGQHVLGG